jgi:hypothetical protein
MLTPSQRWCKDAQNSPRIPVEEASQPVVQSHRKLVGSTLPNRETSPCGACDGADTCCPRICWCCERRSCTRNDQLQRRSNLHVDSANFRHLCGRGRLLWRIDLRRNSHDERSFPRRYSRALRCAVRCRSARLGCRLDWSCPATNRNRLSPLASKRYTMEPRSPSVFFCLSATCNSGLTPISCLSSKRRHAERL